MVRFDPVRSAEPPTSSGRSGFRLSSTFCEALRVAIVSALRCVSAISARTWSSKPAGSSPATRRWNSAASAGKRTAYSSNSFLHLRSARLPAARASQPS